MVPRFILNPLQGPYLYYFNITLTTLLPLHDLIPSLDAPQPPPRKVHLVPCLLVYINRKTFVSAKKKKSVSQLILITLGRPNFLVSSNYSNTIDGNDIESMVPTLGGLSLLSEGTATAVAAAPAAPMLEPGLRNRLRPHRRRLRLHRR